MGRLILVFFLLALAAAACGDRGGDGPPPTAAGVEAPSSLPAAPSASTAPPEGSTPRPGTAPGVTHGTLQHGGLGRTYRLYVPAGIAAGGRAPLVLGLHGGLGSGDQFAANSRFEALAAQERFIVAFPDGVDRTWNGGGCCGGAARKDIDDVGFLAALIEELGKDLPIDRGRVFITGHSNGGIMAFRFGCERPQLVRAIAPVAGSMEIPSCDAPSGTSLLAIHGDSDQSHPLEGGQGPRSIAGVPFTSMAVSLERWTQAMRCETTPTHSTEGALTTTSWKQCRDGAVASLVVIAGADHPWPGGTTRPATEGRTSTAMDATAEIWRFFEALGE